MRGEGERGGKRRETKREMVIERRKGESRGRGEAEGRQRGRMGRGKGEGEERVRERGGIVEA